VRASPTNGTEPTTADMATVMVNVTGCPPASTPAPSLAQQLATGGPLAPVTAKRSSSGRGAANSSPAPTVTGDSALDFLLAPSAAWAGASSADQGAALKLPLLTALVSSVAPSRVVLWSVQSSPVPPKLTLRYNAPTEARFTVVYSRAPAAAAGRLAVTGRVAVTNPNLIDALPLARVQVELYRPGAGTPGVAALATCPRARDGLLVVDSQLTGSGALECGFALDVAAADIGQGALLTAVAVTADGREAVSPPLRLPGPRGAVAGSGPAPGECAALAVDYVTLGEEGSKLLPAAAGAAAPSVAAGGVERLPGEAGGGAAGDVICDTRTITYSSTFGPLAPGACGTYTVSIGLRLGVLLLGIFLLTCRRHARDCFDGDPRALVAESPTAARPGPLSFFSILQATNLAKANPTTGPQRTAAATSDVTLTVTGCPGPAVRVEVLGVQPQRLSGAAWGVAAFSDSAAVTLHWSRTARVEFSATYVPAAAPEAQLLVGSVRVQNLGSAPARVSSVQVEVAPDSSTPVSVAAECPMGPNARLAAGVSVTCRFAAPYSLPRSGTVTARALLAAGAGERTSAPRAFDFDQELARIATGGCAMAADGFAPPGASVLSPNSTSRPPEAEAPIMVCNGHSISFGAQLGPYNKGACGTYTVSGSPFRGAIGWEQSMWPLHRHQEGRRSSRRLPCGPGGRGVDAAAAAANPRSSRAGPSQVTYLARVNPVAGDLPVAPQSAAASVRLTVIGCPGSS
jgi:hypothetical protein